MEENEEQIKSKYSSGINIILRLDQLWKDTHLHSRIGVYSKWNSDLDCIWLELARDYKDDDKDKDTNGEKGNFKNIKEEFDSFDTEIKAKGGFKDKKPEGFKKLSPEEIESRDEIYKILMKKQLFLARLENKLGKGTTLDEGDDYDFD